MDGTFRFTASLQYTSELPSWDLNVHRGNSSVFVDDTEGDFGLAMVILHERVFASELPDYRGLRIRLVSKLNIAH